MTADWIETLGKLVEAKPIVVLSFPDDEWQQLNDSRRGVTEFTIARAHSAVGGIRVPTVCLLIGTGSRGPEAFLGILSSRASVTTIQSRIKVRRALRITPDDQESIVRLVTATAHANNLKQRLSRRGPVAVLTPKLSRALLEGLASIDGNRSVLRVLTDSMSAPKRFNGMLALEEDAVQTALKAFGIASGEEAATVQLVADHESALARVWTSEDLVIQHDARTVPGYELIGGDMTGRAVFEREGERLEVFTANRAPLERVFGVDLVYLNLTRQNVVMVQYKMLEPHRNSDGTDWIYRPDAQLSEEISRMEKFAVTHAPGPFEYRLNPQVFYLKFVKRDASVTNGGFITPLDHYRCLASDPACQGERGALRITYDTLAGRYMRQGAFLDLIRSGYIGAHATDTQQFTTLIQSILGGNRGLVLGVQRPIRTQRQLEPNNRSPLEDLLNDDVDEAF